MAWQDRAYNRDTSEGGGSTVSLPRPTPLALWLIVACVGLFLVRALLQSSGDPLGRWGALTFVGGVAWWQPWRWVTYQYLHADAWHLLMNMLAVYFFLPTLERTWGWGRALGFYTLGGIFAGLVFGLIQMLSPMAGRVSLVGASGSVLAAMGAVALLYPDRQLILLFFPVPIRVGVGLFAAFFLLSALADRSLSDAAHLGGLAFGFLAPWLAGPWLRQRLRDLEQARVRRKSRQEQEKSTAIDRILEKVHTHGMNALSRGERNTLKRATERQRRADLQKARSGGPRRR